MTAAAQYYVELQVTDPARAEAALDDLSFLPGVGRVGDLIAYTYECPSQAEADRHARQAVGRLRRTGIEAAVVGVRRA